MLVYQRVLLNCGCQHLITSQVSAHDKGWLANPKPEQSAMLFCNMTFENPAQEICKNDGSYSSRNMVFDDQRLLPNYDKSG